MAKGLVLVLACVTYSCVFGVTQVSAQQWNAGPARGHQAFTPSPYANPYGYTNPYGYAYPQPYRHASPYSHAYPASAYGPPQSPSTQPQVDPTIPSPDAEDFQLDFDEIAAAESSQTFVDSAPNMIGDFYGLGSLRSTLTFGLSVESRGSIPFMVPIDGAMPWTDTGPSVAGRQVFLGPPPPTNLAGDHSFTTVQSSTDARADINSQALPPTPSVAIVNDSSYQANAATVAAAAVGPGGTTAYVGGLLFVEDQNGADLEEGDLADTEVVYFYDYTLLVPITSPSAGGVVGQIRPSENNSPIPRDRLIFDYNGYNNVPLGFSGQPGFNVNRFTLGIEKAFFGGGLSWDIRMPGAGTLNSSYVTSGPLDTSNYEAGNLYTSVKALLWSNPYFALTGGLGIQIPTGNSSVVRLSSGAPLVTVRNQTVHLFPYLACLHTPNEGVFFQGFFTVDVPAGANTVRTNDPFSGMASSGTLQDPTLLIFDVSVGTWVYRSANPRPARLNSIALAAELHYTASTSGFGGATIGNLVIADVGNSFDILNATFGLHTRFGANTAVTVGYGTPINQERVFDGELRVMVNHYFGPLSN